MRMDHSLQVQTAQKTPPLLSKSLTTQGMRGEPESPSQHVRHTPICAAQTHVHIPLQTRTRLVS